MGSGTRPTQKQLKKKKKKNTFYIRTFSTRLSILTSPYTDQCTISLGSSKQDNLGALTTRTLLFTCESIAVITNLNLNLDIEYILVWRCLENT